MMGLPMRQKKILKKLVALDGWVKGRELAEEMEVTPRTIRTDIAAINVWLKTVSCHIESSRQEGYRLRGQRQSELEAMLWDGTDVPLTPQERMRILGIRLLQADEEKPEDVDELEEEMFVSRTTLESGIFKIKAMLESRTTPMYIKRCGRKIWTSGEEETRRFLLKELMVDRTDPDYLMIENYDDYFGADVPEKMMDCVLNALADNDISMTAEDILHLVIYLSIKLTRIHTGYEFQSKTKDIMAPEDMNWSLSETIAAKVKTEFSTVFNEEELVDLAVQLSLFRLIGSEPEARPISKPEQSHYEYVVNELLKDIKNKFHLDLTDDQELKDGLVTHIRYTLKRITMEPVSTNPVLMLLKTEYPFVFDMSLFLYERFYDVFGVRLNENELGYVATYLGSAVERMERKKSPKDFTIAVVTGMNYGTSRLMTTRLKAIYGDSCNIEGPFSIYAVQEIEKLDPTFVITTESKQVLKNFHVPKIQISPLLNEKDQREINKWLLHMRKEMMYDQLPKSIKDYFHEELFFYRLKSETPKEVIKTMSEHLMHLGFAGDDFAEKTLEREQVASTIFGNKIAMPHPIEACAKKTVISVGILEHPISWGSGEAQLIFMLAVKKEDMKYLNSFFDLTVRLVDDEGLVKRLLDSRDLAQFKDRLPIL
ncbi:BglG family transcription antiterminator [Anaerostipes sp.]|uniref:BglG family transcription antiterminator n=1 Tax=Anaerostipes sp. TaxID=1872530 RepID=UPI0025C293B3|nr:BglG family transcription antiterminator [Anaerostipes sp.]MBS7007146.1 transcription antiterminator [Anaerostipes sp.]